MDKEEKRRKAKELYEESKGKKTLQEISDELGVNINTLKTWKYRDDWKKVNKLKDNKNAIGNIGGGAPRENINALKNGKYRKYIAKEEKQLLDDLKKKGATPLDLLRENIYIAQSKHIYRTSKMNNEDNLKESIISASKITRMVKEYYKLAGEEYELNMEIKRAELEKLKSDDKKTNEEKIDNYFEKLEDVIKMI